MKKRPTHADFKEKLLKNEAVKRAYDDLEEDRDLREIRRLQRKIRLCNRIMSVTLVVAVVFYSTVFILWLIP